MFGSSVVGSGRNVTASDKTVSLTRGLLLDPSSTIISNERGQVYTEGPVLLNGGKLRYSASRTGTFPVIRSTLQVAGSIGNVEVVSEDPNNACLTGTTVVEGGTMSVVISQCQQNQSNSLSVGVYIGIGIGVVVLGVGNLLPLLFF